MAWDIDKCNRHSMMGMIQFMQWCVPAHAPDQWDNLEKNLLKKEVEINWMEGSLRLSMTGKKICDRCIILSLNGKCNRDSSCNTM